MAPPMLDKTTDSTRNVQRRRENVSQCASGRLTTSRIPDTVAASLAVSQMACQSMRRASAYPRTRRREAGTLLWYGAEYDLEDYIAYTFYGHKREHMAQVNVFLDTVKRR